MKHYRLEIEFLHLRFSFNINSNIHILMCPMLFIRTKISLSYNFKNLKLQTLKKYFLSCNLTNFCSEGMWYNKGFTERKPFSSFWKEVCQAGWLSLLLGKVCDSALHTIKSHINVTYWSYCWGGWLRRTLHKCYLLILY